MEEVGTGTWQRAECTRAGLFDLLPQEIVVENIFSACTYGELLILSEVCKDWRVKTNN